MPIYEYEPCDGACRICKEGFSLNRPLSAPPLEKCPLCRKPVRKILSGFSTPKILKPLSVSDAKQAGFQVWKRVNRGEYERQ
jgi:putative FmdB family regulatory protein